MAEADPKVAGEAPAPIIVKKITIEEAGHHGGAWKVAYADFVTAMMAFFLLLWLLGATEENQRKGLADYFSPTLVKLRQEGAGSDGMLGGNSITDVDKYPNQQGATGGPLEGGGKGEPREDKLKRLRDEIESKLASRKRARNLVRQVRVISSPEGIRIDLVDDADFSMFSLGTTILTEDARTLLDVIGETLAEESAPLILRGHTDSLPWRPGIVANNWSLSTGRAEATRQALIRGGMEEERFARIEGVADREPLITDDPTDPRNRRISLLLLEDEPVRTRPFPQAKIRRTAEAAAPAP